jgi:tyrosine-protein phosphatase SIW14
MHFARRYLISLLALSPVFAGSVPGIENFDKVDAHVYRGGQPSDDGFRYLAKLGVKTIIDLREADERSKVEERVVTGAGMKYANVPMTGLTPPTDAEITKILAILAGSPNEPVFVHCKRGADRTGAVIAAYHINYHGWDNARALKDAKAHKMGSFQFPRQNYIKNFRPRAVDTKATSVADATAAVPPVGALSAAPGSKN